VGSVTEERGQVVPLVAIVVVLVGVLCLGLARLGGSAGEAARARTAADAAALAGAADGEASARELARANGGRVVRYEVDGDEVEVLVEVGDHRAVARAVATAGQPTRGRPLR
jgi:ABC-type molybdate transport system ATPase subunit